MNPFFAQISHRGLGLVSQLFEPCQMSAQCFFDDADHRAIWTARFFPEVGEEIFVNAGRQGGFRSSRRWTARLSSRSALLRQNQLLAVSRFMRRYICHDFYHAIKSVIYYQIFYLTLNNVRYHLSLQTSRPPRWINTKTALAQASMELDMDVHDDMPSPTRERNPLEDHLNNIEAQLAAGDLAWTRQRHLDDVSTRLSARLLHKRAMGDAKRETAHG